MVKYSNKKVKKYIYGKKLNVLYGMLTKGILKIDAAIVVFGKSLAFWKRSKKIFPNGAINRPKL